MKKNTSATLVQGIGTFGAIALVFGSMIGSGAFKKVSVMSQHLGSPGWVMLAWALAGGITLIGALSNAEVASQIAASGGQYQYFKRMYGKAFAFMYGWTSVAVIQTATIAAVAYVFGQSLHQWLQLPNWEVPGAEFSLPFGIQPLNDLPVKLLTAGLIVALTLINALGVRIGGSITTLMGSAVVLCILLISAVGLSSPMADPSLLTHSIPPSPETDSGFLPLFFAALMAAFWAYEGWNNVGFVGEEIKNPERSIPRALILGVGLVMALYLLLNLTFLMVMPVDQIQGISDQEVAGISIMRYLGGETWASVVAVLILVSTFNATNTTVLTAPRVCFAMARDGLFFPGIERLHPKRGTPVRALILQGFWAIVLVFSGSFDPLTDMLIFAAFIFYGMGAFGVFVLRKKQPGIKPPFSVPGYPVLPAIFVVFSAALVALSIWNNPKGSAAGLGLMALGLPFYWIWNQRSTGNGASPNNLK